MAVLTVVADEEAVARTSAERITALIEEALSAFGPATVCLTGGSTPRRLYELLADDTEPWRGRIEWSRVHLFWGDERHVPPDHEDSNFGMANRALVSRVPVPASQVHRMRGEIPDADEAARLYEQELAEGFRAAGRTDQTFDVMLLGLGEDAHIASLFPGSPVLEERERRTAAPRVARLGAFRITLTPPALLDARRILLIVAGESKADAVAAALEGPDDVSRWPAQLLRAAGDRVEWIIDPLAARHLRRGAPLAPRE
jgi:6-phosphogluconolactonase